MVWAMLTMKLINVQAIPDPKKDGVFVSKGPYALIRHPMYTSLLMVTIPMVVDYYSLSRLFVVIVLFINLMVKIQYEEGLLLRHYKAYAVYRKKTWKIIPWLY